MKKLISLILTLAVLLSMTTVIADEEIKVFVDGELVVFDAQPFIENDRTLVPIRAIAEKLGAEVTWDAPTQNIELKMDGVLLQLTVGENIISKNTENIEIDVPAKIVDDRTYLPLRAVSEALDCDVHWDGDAKAINIISKSRKTEYSILNDRLTITIDENEFDGQIHLLENSTDNQTTSMTFETEKGKISLIAGELYRTSVGNLEEDVKNYDMIVDENGVISQGGLEYARMKSNFEILNSITENIYLIKTSDDFLIQMHIFASGGMVGEDLFEDISSKLILTLKAGERLLDSSAVEQYVQQCGMTLVINKPEGYVAYSGSKGNVDFWNIQKVVTSASKFVPYISICLGNSSEYNIKYKGELPKQIVEGDFSRGKIQWRLYEEDNYMQASNGTYYIYAYAETPEQQKEFIDIVSQIKVASVASAAKPVIYLYPEEEQEVNVKLDLDGEFTFTYPEYNNSWTVTAKPDGTIVSDGEEYSYLFWEGEMPTFKPDFKEGFVVKGSDSAEFLRETLEQMGLTPREYNEFIVYWAPKLQENEYNKIYFAQEEYEECAKLEITPEPDSILRVFMVYEKADVNTVLPKQEIKPFEREGFTVVEWGGYLAE